ISKPSPRGRLFSGEPNPVDVHVGCRLRLRRLLLGMSQEKLAAALGITFQQVQRYERGTNRIAASRLWDMSLVLNCPVSFFYEEMANNVAEASPRNLSRTGAASMPTEFGPPPEEDLIVRRETLDLVRAYYTIKDPRVRRQIWDLTKALTLADRVGGPETASIAP